MAAPITSLPQLDTAQAAGSVCNQIPHAKVRTFQTCHVQPSLSFLQSQPREGQPPLSPHPFLPCFFPSAAHLSPLTTFHCALELQALVSEDPYILSLSPKCPLHLPTPLRAGSPLPEKHVIWQQQASQVQCSPCYFFSCPFPWKGLPCILFFFTWLSPTHSPRKQLYFL